MKGHRTPQYLNNQLLFKINDNYDEDRQFTMNEIADDVGINILRFLYLSWAWNVWQSKIASESCAKWSLLNSCWMRSTMKQGSMDIMQKLTVAMEASWIARIKKCMTALFNGTVHFDPYHNVKRSKKRFPYEFYSIHMKRSDKMTVLVEKHHVVLQSAYLLDMAPCNFFRF